MLIRAYLCLLMFTYVHDYLPMFTLVYLRLFTPIY